MIHEPWEYERSNMKLYTNTFNYFSAKNSENSEAKTRNYERPSRESEIKLTQFLCNVLKKK